MRQSVLNWKKFSLSTKTKCALETVQYEQTLQWIGNVKFAVVIKYKFW